MLGSLMVALFLAARALRQLGHSLFHEEPLPYLVHQPLPWQVQYVTQSRRASRDCGKGSRHNSIYSMGRRGEDSASEASRPSAGDDSPTPSSERTEPSDPAEKAAVASQTPHCTHHQRQK